MGRGTILAELGQGQYTVKLDFGESRLAAQLLLLTGANSELDTQIAAQQAKVNSAQAALDASNAALSAAINAYVANNSSPNLLPPLEAAKLDQVAKEEDLRRETVAIGKLRSSKANNLRKIEDLNSYRASLTLNAWCADYTEGASGEVATLEIPNEPQTVLIAPGGRAPVDADGELRMRALMTPEQAYYNAAILPGWQKFKPTYRSGVITAINGDTADVALDEAKSSASGIADIGLANIEFNVNQTSTLTNVPIVYQDCNGEAFSIGDLCVVEFQGQNWTNPKIIGFKSNPIACNRNFPGFFLGYGNVKLKKGGFAPAQYPTSETPNWTIDAIFTSNNNGIAWDDSPGWVNIGSLNPYIIVLWTSLFTLVDGIAIPYIKPEWEQQIRNLVPDSFKTAVINPVLMRNAKQNNYGIFDYPVIDYQNPQYNFQRYRVPAYSVPIPWVLASLDVIYGNIEIDNWPEMTAEITNESLATLPGEGTILVPIANPFNKPKRWTNPIFFFNP